MAKNTPAVQPNATDLNSIDFTSDITRAVTEAIAQSVAEHLANSGLVSDAVVAVLTRRRAALAAAVAESERLARE